MLVLNRNFAWRLAILLTVTFAAVLFVSLLKPIRQDLAFHQFADDMPLFGVSNFWNVISNIGFVIVGCSGLVMVARSSVNQFSKITFSILFLSIAFTGIGSASYHLHPDNDYLVWDRIPMTLVFMSFLSMAIGQCINKLWGFIVLFPLLCIGIGTVLWWHYTESRGAGDLRFYGLVQFLPIVLVPLIFILFPADGSRKIWPLFGWIIGWYVVAKILEHFDKEMLQFTHVISGHSLKHIAASVATLNFIVVFKQVRK